MAAFCSKCDKEMAEGAGFCSACGKRAPVDPVRSRRRLVLALGGSIAAIILVALIVGLISPPPEQADAQLPGDEPTAAAPVQNAGVNSSMTEKDRRLLDIGTHLQELGGAAGKRSQQSDDASVQEQSIVEGAADEMVGCEVWSSMAIVTTPEMDKVCKDERGIVNGLPAETQAAIERQMAVVRKDVAQGRYPE
jgi:hypothetical protein